MNRDTEDIAITLFLAAYWLFGGYCLTVIIPWPIPAYAGLALAALAVIGFAVFKSTEGENREKGNGCLGMLLFFPPLTLAIVGKAVWLTLG